MPWAQFSVSIKVNFYSEKQANEMISTIVIPMQLTESKSDARKCHNESSRVSHLNQPHWWLHKWNAWMTQLMVSSEVPLRVLHHAKHGTLIRGHVRVSQTFKISSNNVSKGLHSSVDPPTWGCFGWNTCVM